MYFLSKMGIFHCYVSLPEGILYIYIYIYRKPFVSFRSLDLRDRLMKNSKLFRGDLRAHHTLEEVEVVVLVAV